MLWKQKRLVIYAKNQWSKQAEEEKGEGGWEVVEKRGPQSVTLYRDAQHGASVDLGLQTEIMIMPVKTRVREESRAR